MERSKRHHVASCLIAGIVSAITVGSSQSLAAQNTEEEVFAWRLRTGVAIPTEEVLKNIGDGREVASLVAKPFWKHELTASYLWVTD
jgi:hypothetical protein